MVSLRERIRRRFRPKPKLAPVKRTSSLFPTGGQSRPGGPVIVTPSGKVVGTAKIPIPSPIPVIKPVIKRKIVGPIIPIRKKPPVPKPRFFTPLPKKDIITLEQRKEIIRQEKRRKISEKLEKITGGIVSLGPPRVTKEKFKKFVGFDTFEKEVEKEETKLQSSLESFSQGRLNFYQGLLDSGKISETEANKEIQEDVEKETNKLIQSSEFFKSKGARRPTTNDLSFFYETERLNALKSGDKKRAGAFRFLGLVSETPTALVKLGKDINNLINDPKARETSEQRIKEALKKENLKKLPSTIELKATELTNFILSSPTEAIAEVAGTILIFGLVGKGARGGLRLTGALSKSASKEVLRKLKIPTITRKGLKEIGEISVKVSPNVLKATRVGKPLLKGAKVSANLTKAFNQAVKKSKIGITSVKVYKDFKRINRKIKLGTSRIK